jgi:flagellin
MAYSIQTNVNSIQAQENLRVNGEFQSRTINRLTSGYRINSSGDDAAGLAVANKFRGDITELNQGVRNANDGISTLEIVDGGLNNISQMLDRLRTLATQSASTTFTGNRGTLNTEFQTLLTEIDRQASNIGLNGGGKFSTNIAVYTGGGNTTANSSVQVNLAGQAVDVAGLGLANMGVDTGGTNCGATNAAITAAETFTLRVGANAPVTVTTLAAGSTTAVVDDLNTKLQTYGLSASLDSSNNLIIGGQGPFEITATGGATTLTSAATLKTYNTSPTVYSTAATTIAAATETITVTTASGTLSSSITATNQTDFVTAFNSAFKSLGVAAYDDGAGKAVIQGAGSFGITSSAAVMLGATSVATTAGAGTSINGNAMGALDAITRAVTRLGNVQGKVGTGQNQLNYAISLAQSQITSFSAAESRIRDTDVAAEAANLTKAQVLQQTSIAAMAQANFAPQAIMALLRG